MTFNPISWLALFGLLSVLAFRRPVFGAALYLLAFFAQPAYWYWGHALGGVRWSLLSGGIWLVAVLIHKDWTFREQDRGRRRVTLFVLLMAANATFVHFLLAPDITISAEGYISYLKYVLLYFLVLASVRESKDFVAILVALALGVGYFGYEATFIGVGNKIVSGRLEGFGGPNADSSNGLAFCLSILLPLVGGLLFIGNRWQKGLSMLCAPLGLNVIMMCNVRGAFLGMISAAIMLLVTAKGHARKHAIIGLLLGSVAAYLLMGDERIYKRFMTTFASAEERDQNAVSRLAFWKAGLQAVRDYPFGSGGEGFRIARGGPYLAEAKREIASEGLERSVHNGYINDAFEWGIQGLILRLAFLTASGWCAYKTMGYRSRIPEDKFGILGPCLVGSLTALLVASIFGDGLGSEWGFWAASLAVVYSRVYGVGSFEQDLAADQAVMCAVYDGASPQDVSMHEGVESGNMR